ncbi:PASTA domain-containing protein, partial [Saprospiraceae bacterium]|nr:PASTA domain-containing protein [Saprospiraceae bacterium]
MIILLALLLLGLNIYLRLYTNHGQKLTLPDFNDMHINEAQKLAKEKSFELIVNDSTQIVGKPGGMIINQNPKGDSKVKENRKVYVTTTKYLADKIRLSSLPELYGRDFEQKMKELSHMKINARIKDYKFDAAEPDHILEVYYKGDLIVDSEGRAENVRIDKGGTLDFVLSKTSGLAISIPDLQCKTLAA